MKKKILSFCLAFAVIVPAIFLLSACGDDKNTIKKERVNTAEIVDIYQDPSAGVYVEVTGLNILTGNLLVTLVIMLAH